MVFKFNVYVCVCVFNLDENARRDGYVPNTIRVNVPAIEGGGGVTPHHNIQSPHPQDIQMGK